MRVSLDERLDIRKGREVEVCYEENGFKAVWYKAIIEATPKSGFSVRLLKDDFATPLTQLSLNVLLRPLPPRHLQARINIKEGCVVDAYHKDGWWTGFVVKELEDYKCLVFFDSPPDIIQFYRKDLRPHLKWVDKKWWVIPAPNLQLLTEESMFRPGTMVEVSSKTDKMEIVWVPAMIIKEIKEDDEKKKYIVKFCNKPFSWEGNKERSNETVDSQSVRPTPPSFLVQKYKLFDCVEAFRGSRWCKGVVKRVVSQKSYMVSFKDTRKQLQINHSDLRPPMEWENGVWKTRESPLAQGSENKMGDSVMNSNTPPSLANESVSPVTSSPVITSTPLKHTEAKTQGKLFPKKTLQPMRDQNGLGNDATREKGLLEKETLSDCKRNNSAALESRNVQTKEPLLAQGSGNEMADGLLNVQQEKTQIKTSNEKTLEPLRTGNESTREKMPEKHNSEDNRRKRKRRELDHNSDLSETVVPSDRTSNVVKNFAADEDEKSKAKDATVVLPFVKKSPVWKAYESMEIFKGAPQSPHFSPLFETKEDFREGFALGMMVTFYGVLEKVKDLETDVPISQLNSLKDSLTELEKHGFTVTVPLSRINKLLALKDRQLNILKELEGFDKEMVDESSKKRKAEQEFCEMERKIFEVKSIILELQRQEAALRKQKNATNEKICQMESRARDLGVELEDVEFEFETVLSAPW